MTIEALRQMQLVIDNTNNPQVEAFARKVHYIIEGGIDKGLLPEKVSELPKATHSKFDLDPDTGSLNTHDGKSVRVHPKYFQILSALYEHMGEPVHSAEILKSLGLSRYSVPENYTISYISRIRRLLDKLGLCNETFPDGYILTIQKIGYVLVDPEDNEHVRKYHKFSRRMHR